MPIVHCKGRVLPFPAVIMSINDLPPARWEEPGVGLIMNFTVKVVDSEVDVECDMNRYQDDDFGHVHMRAYDLARAAVDIYSFTSGLGLTVYLDTFIKPDGTSLQIFPQYTNLSKLSTAFDMTAGNTSNNNFGAFWQLVVSEPALFMAMNDLIVSISLPHHASVNCGRAIDGIRVMMCPPGLKRSQGWPIVRQSLNLDEAYLLLITDTSTGPRHGDRTFIPGATVTEITERSWVVMDRFLEFRKRGNQPLPLAAFPLLLG
jgi:hypothetical protein